MKFLWWGCEHDWNLVKKRFIPPVEREIEVNGALVGNSLLEKLVSGYTRRTWSCAKCDKVVTNEVIGDDT